MVTYVDSELMPASACSEFLCEDTDPEPDTASVEMLGRLLIVATLVVTVLALLVLA
jgi:hypothetical protein